MNIDLDKLIAIIASAILNGVCIAFLINTILAGSAIGTAIVFAFLLWLLTKSYAIIMKKKKKRRKKNK